MVKLTVVLPTPSNCAYDMLDASVATVAMMAVVKTVMRHLALRLVLKAFIEAVISALVNMVIPFKKC